MSELSRSRSCCSLPCSELQVAWGQLPCEHLLAPGWHGELLFLSFWHRGRGWSWATPVLAPRGGGMARRAPVRQQPASRGSGGGEGSGAAALVQPFQFSNLPRCVSASAPARLNCWQPLPRTQGLLWLRRGGLRGCAACSRQLRWHPAARRPGQLLVPPFQQPILLIICSLVPTVS